MPATSAVLRAEVTATFLERPSESVRDLRYTAPTEICPLGRVPFGARGEGNEPADRLRGERN